LVKFNYIISLQEFKLFLLKSAMGDGFSGFFLKKKHPKNVS